MGDVGSRHQRESWALPWGAAWEFHVVPGAGGSQHKALDTSGVTFSSSRIHRSTGDPGRSRAGPRSRSSPEGSGTVGRPDLGQQPRPQPLSPASLTVGASGPVQGVPQAPGPADQPCALPATWTHPPMSWGTRSISQKEAAVRSRRDFLGHSANPADAPSTSPVEGVSTLPEVPQGRGAGPPQDSLTICGLRKVAGPVSRVLVHGARRVVPRRPGSQQQHRGRARWPRGSGRFVSGVLPEARMHWGLESGFGRGKRPRREW